MADSNVAIITELKTFLEKKSNNSNEREQYTFSPKSFLRKRVLTFERISVLIVSSLKRTLSLELSKFSELFSVGLSCSKQAFCEQRAKLAPSFFHDWNQVFVQSFYQHHRKNIKTWKDLIVWAVDGSTISLPQTEELRNVFGWASSSSESSGKVTARVCLISDVLNEVVVSGRLHSYFSSEEDAFINVLDGKDTEGKVLIFDRGYPSYWLEYLLMQKGVKFIMRVKKNENKQIIDFLSSDAMDITEDWYPSYKSLKKLESLGMDINQRTPIKIRMIKVLLNTGETEALITNLYDTEKYDAKSMEQAYHFRWGIETTYSTLKEKLQLEQFSGIRQICIEQDFFANLFLYNLQCLIEKQAEPYLENVNKKRKHNYKINKNVSLGILKEHVVRLFMGNNCRQVLRDLEKLFGNYLEPVRPGRKYPRFLKQRPNKKYYTLTNYKRAL